MAGHRTFGNVRSSRALSAKGDENMMDMCLRWWLTHSKAIIYPGREEREKRRYRNRMDYIAYRLG